MTNDSPKVSVITFVYVSHTNGRGPLLRETLASVADQKYPSYEHVVVDDGSEVDLEDLVEEFPFTRLVKKPGTGIVSSTATFNLGHQIARGQYCIYLPSDDVHFEGAIAGMAAALDANPASDMAIGRALYEYSSGTTKTWSPDPDAIASKISEGNYINGCAVMWRRTAAILDDLPPNYTGFCSDYDLFATLSMTTQVVYPAVDVVRYREVPDSTRKSTRSHLNVSPRRGDRLFFQYTKAARIAFVQNRIARRRGGCPAPHLSEPGGRIGLNVDYSVATVMPMIAKRQWSAAADHLLTNSASFAKASKVIEQSIRYSCWELEGQFHLANLVLMQRFSATYSFEPWIDEPPDSWYFEFLPTPAIAAVRNRSGDLDRALTRYLGI